jgi:hypothetical protein
MDFDGFSGWWDTARTAQYLGYRSARRIQQFYHAGRLRGVMVGTPGKLRIIKYVDGNPVTMQCRGGLVLRIDPESVYELEHDLERRRQQVALNKMRRAARRREFFASRTPRYDYRGVIDHEYHDGDDL